MQYRADSAFAVCGASFVPDADELVEIPDTVAQTIEFKDFAERNARSINKVSKAAAAPQKGE